MDAPGTVAEPAGTGTTRGGLPRTLFGPLPEARSMASLISAVTGEAADRVLARLHGEYEAPGSTVRAAFRQRGLEPYVWSEDLVRFYQETDAFLYELAVWNCNRIKRSLRRWIGQHLRRAGDGPLNVLSIGDGLGFDSAYLSLCGHRVTYFEVPGWTEALARLVFQECSQPVEVLTDPQAIEPEAYDVVLCLDVLEHVPDPPAMVRTMAGYLRPGGRLVAHAPFYMIHPSYITHLKSNRRYSGSLALYRQGGLTLVDGRAGWNPLVLLKGGPTDGARSVSLLRMWPLGLFGAYFALGRVSVWPFLPVDVLRRVKTRWFGQQ